MVNFFDEWSTEWGSSQSDFSVLSQTSDYGDAILDLDASAGDRHAVSWDNPGNATDVEMVALVETPSFSSNFDGEYCRLYCRGGGSESSEEAYYVGLRENAGFVLDKYYNSGAASNLASTGSFSENQKYWMRFRVESIGIGDNNIKAKNWLKGESEPSNWQFDIDDTSSGVPDSGWIGIGGFPEVSQQWDYIGIGLGGESAPLPTPSIVSAQPASASTLVRNINIPQAPTEEGFGFSNFGSFSFGSSENAIVPTVASTEGKARASSFITDYEVSKAHFIGDVEISSIASAEFQKESENVEFDIVDENDNIVVLGDNNKPQRVTLNTVVTKQAHSTELDVEQQKTELKSLVENDAEDNTFVFQSKKGTIIINDISVPEEGDLNNLKEVKIDGFFLPWPKYNPDAF